MSNNDFWFAPVKYNGDWAQESLVSAERLLADQFKLPRPSWLNATYYDDFVMKV